jgi:cobyrinic acid a,c-diamide synthase
LFRVVSDAHILQAKGGRGIPSFAFVLGAESHFGTACSRYLTSSKMANGLEKRAGIVIGALRGGSGKTMVSLGLIAALTAEGRQVAPFKKGPDYIDAGWLSLAAGRPCYNLDTFLIDADRIRQTFHVHTRGLDLAVIEGNRGIYDCIDTHGETSTAELAKLLGLPILLIIDGTKTTRTMAAVVSGCALFDPAVRIGGVVLNRIAGARHEGILRRSIEEHCGIPVVGAIPKLRRQCFPERHMGLVPTPEHAWARTSIATAAEIVRDHLDLAAITRMARASEYAAPSGILAEAPAAAASTPTIGIIQDSAFQFYYPENIEALRAAGAELVFFSPLEVDRLPDIDGLYIGGGFPETHAGRLSRNATFRNQLKDLAEQGLPIYAECGGLMYLGRKLVLPEGTFDMAGILPVVFGFSRRPQGHGYTIIDVTGANPYFRTGSTLKGHEFHYSSVLEWEGREDDLAYTMVRGTGLVNGRDGLCHKNVLATYTHLHAQGTPDWAPALVRKAIQFRQSKSSTV